MFWSGSFLAVFVLLSVSKPSSAAWCPLGWQYHRGDDMCVKLYGSNGGLKAGWDSAQSFCSAVNANLATVKSASKRQFIKNNFSISLAWIALKNYATNGYSFRWIGGSYLGRFRSWRPGQPDNYNGQEKCVAVNGFGQWLDRNCNKAEMYLCEKRSE